MLTAPRGARLAQPCRCALMCSPCLRTRRALSDILVEATPEVFGGGRPNADGAGKGTSV